jgi:small-conductance mechanosensitive channel
VNDSRHDDNRHSERTARLRVPGLAVRALIVLAAGLALAIPIARAGAQSVEGLNSKIESARAEAEELGAAVQSATDALAAARARAEQAAAREQELAEVLAEGRERAAELAEQVEEARAELHAVRERFRRAQDALAERLVAIYKSNDPVGIDVLLDSKGFDDLATRADLLTRIQEADRVLVERVRELRAALDAELARVEEAKAEADAFNARVESARAEIAGVRDRALAEAAELQEARAAQLAAIEGLQSRIGRWTKQVQELEQVSEQEARRQVANWVGDWAIPEAIVMCESGGNFNALNPSSGAGGAYQILPSTWKAYGGKGLPHQASPAEQHAIAAQIWADSGASAWVCAG